MRPTDWFLVELPVDPVPGDAFGVRGLAAKYAAIAEIADEAALGVHAARTSGAASAWVGDAGDVFRDRSHRMPGELARAQESYAAVDAALRRWAETIDDTQTQADRGLQQAREAHADRATAAGALASAELAWTTAHAQQLTYQALQKSPLSVPPPTPAQLRSTDRATQHAQLTIAAARGQIADADARLAAARALVLEAKARRDDGERATVQAIAAAADLAVQPSSVWEAIQDSAAWQTIVAVATVVLTVLSIVAIFVGGPLVWALILAATILLVVNALLSIAQGKDAWLELASLAVGLIPGGAVATAGVRILSTFGRVATTLDRLAEMKRVVEGATEMFEAGTHVKSVRVNLDAEATRFTQNTVSFTKTDRLTGEKYTLDDMIESMRSEGWKGEPVDAVRMPDGGISSVDNTRVLAAREAQIPLEANVHEPAELLTSHELERFDPTQGDPVETWGDVALNRIQGQRPRVWSESNPFGSLDRPRVTGRP